MAYRITTSYFCAWCRKLTTGLSTAPLICNECKYTTHGISLSQMLHISKLTWDNGL